MSNQDGKLSTRLKYSAIRLPCLGLIGLSISSFAAIIPTAVSSPGIPKSRSELTRPARLRETDNESFLQVHVDAPMPFLRTDAAQSFNQLRNAVIKGAGFDFLARLGDMMRTSGAKPAKPGVSFYSRHKKGEAFDYNQEDSRVLLVREYGEKGLQWRTYLLCQEQDGSLGTKATLPTDNAGVVSAYIFDFTATAERFGWERIYAQHGWGKDATKKEFWHYQFSRNASNAAVATSGAPQPSVGGKLTYNSSNGRWWLVQIPPKTHNYSKNTRLELRSSTQVRSRLMSDMLELVFRDAKH